MAHLFKIVVPKYHYEEQTQREIIFENLQEFPLNIENAQDDQTDKEIVQLSVNKIPEEKENVLFRWVIKEPIKLEFKENDNTKTHKKHILYAPGSQGKAGSTQKAVRTIAGDRLFSKNMQAEVPLNIIRRSSENKNLLIFWNVHEFESHNKKWMKRFRQSESIVIKSTFSISPDRPSERPSESGYDTTRAEKEWLPKLVSTKEAIDKLNATDCVRTVVFMKVLRFRWLNIPAGVECKLENQDLDMPIIKSSRKIDVSVTHMSRPNHSSTNVTSRSSKKRLKLRGASEMRVKDCQMTCSSYLIGFDACKGRLNGEKCWRPKKFDTNSFLKIDFLKPMVISRLILQGWESEKYRESGGADLAPNQSAVFRVTKFRLDYSDDGATWTCHQFGEISIEQDEDRADASTAEFENKVEEDDDPNEKFSISILPPILARFVRIRPLESQNGVAIRCEFYFSQNPNVANTYPRVLMLNASEITHGGNALAEVLKDKPPNIKVFQYDLPGIIAEVISNRTALTNYCVLQSTSGENVEINITSPPERSKLLHQLFCDELLIGEKFGSLAIIPIDFRKSTFEEKSWYTDFVGKSKQITEIVVEDVEAGSRLTFDYLCLLTSASVIAGGGLAINSVVAVVASMLVSPIMGPVLAVTFGTTIRKKELFWLGLWVEAFSLLICMFVGFILGLLWASTWLYDYHNWPTDEMVSRGTASCLVEGMLIAVPSGIGVAVSVLGGNMASLVGVAISASLLPPAVNFGMFVACGMFSKHPKDIERAIVSLSLTLENILVIFFISLLIFKLKEIIPQKSQESGAFWSAAKRMLPDTQEEEPECVETPPQRSVMNVTFREDGNVANALSVHKRGVHSRVPSHRDLQSVMMDMKSHGKLGQPQRTQGSRLRRRSTFFS